MRYCPFNLTFPWTLQWLKKFKEFLKLYNKSVDRAQYLTFSGLMHTDPKSGAKLVCQRVSQSRWGRDDTWHISEVYLDWVLVTASQVVWPLLLACSCCFVIGTVFPVLRKFWRAFRHKLEAFVQGKLTCISKLLCRDVYDWFSFFPFEN